MFLDNLSTSVLRRCDQDRLSYEAASELCDLSSRYFGDIARGKTAPTILTLEKLCNGFQCTPNELLLSSQLPPEITFRLPRLVQQIRCYEGNRGLLSFPVCPRCQITMEREYQSFCDHCGQRLNWQNFDHAQIIFSR